MLIYINSAVVFWLIVYSGCHFRDGIFRKFRNRRYLLLCVCRRHFTWTIFTRATDDRVRAQLFRRGQEIRRRGEIYDGISVLSMHERKCCVHTFWFR